jgi:hypothetical protein
MGTGSNERTLNWFADRPWMSRIAFAAAALIGALGLAFDRSPYDMFAAGILCGGLAVFGTAVWMLPQHQPETISSAGQDDEIETARALDRLTRFGWRPVHDRALDDSAIDHIVIGPAGVYAVETKTLDGPISVKRGRVSADGEQRPDIAKEASSAATEIADIVAITGTDASVSALMVFWGDFGQGLVEDDDITYIAGNQLVEWLHARPAKLSGAEIDQLADAITDPPTGARLSLVS